MKQAAKRVRYLIHVIQLVYDVNQFFSNSNLGNSCTVLEIVGKLQKVWEKSSFEVLQLYIDLFGTYTGGSREGGGIGWSRIKQCRGCPRCLLNFDFGGRRSRRIE